MEMLLYVLEWLFSTNSVYAGYAISAVGVFPMTILCMCGVDSDGHGYSLGEKRIAARLLLAWPIYGGIVVPTLIAVMLCATSFYLTMGLRIVLKFAFYKEDKASQPKKDTLLKEAEVEIEELLRQTA